MTRNKGRRWFAAMLDRFGSYTNEEAPALPTDWYKRKVTAKEQGEFWVHTLLGR